MSNDAAAVKRKKQADVAGGRQQRFLHSICACLFIKVLNDEVIADEGLQALVLSAYAAKSGKIHTEPFEVFIALSKACDVILPDVLPALTKRCDLRAAFRFRVLQCLRQGRGHPSTLTVALASLYRALKVPARLVTCVEDDLGGRTLSYAERKDLLYAQLGTGNVRLGRARPPMIWVEVYWPEMSSWVGVQMYEKLFHFHALCGKPKHLKLGEVNGLYLSKFADRVLPRLDRTQLVLQETQSENEKVNKQGGFGALLLSSSDSEDFEDLAPQSSQAKPATMTPARMTISGKGNSHLQSEIEEESLLTTLTMTETQRSESNPFKVFGTSNSLQLAKSHFNKKAVSVYAITSHSELKSVSPRYFSGTRSARQKLFRSVQSPIITLFRDLIKIDLTKVSPQERHLEALDETQLAKCRLSEPMPRNLAGFNRHPVYALESQIKPTEILRDNAKPVACFKGQNVFSRQDVLELYSVDMWMKKGRQVPLTTKPVKTVVKKKNDIPIPISLFTSDQTVPLSEEAYQARLTESGKFTVVKDAILPSGFVLLKESLFPGVTKAARSLDVQFNIAITAFTFTGGKIQSVKDGIVVKLADEETIMDRQRGIERRMIREALYERRERASQWWRVSLKMIAALGAPEVE